MPAGCPESADRGSPPQIRRVQKSRSRLYDRPHDEQYFGKEENNAEIVL